MWRNKNCHVNILDTISAKFCISRILFCLHAELFYISEHYSENFWTHTLLNFLLSRLTNFRLAILTLLLHILVKTNLFLHAQCYRIHRIKKFGKNTSFLTLKVGSAPNLESFSKTKIMHRILKKKDLIPQTWIIWMPKVGCSKKNFLNTSSEILCNWNRVWQKVFFPCICIWYYFDGLTGNLFRKVDVNVMTMV